MNPHQKHKDRMTIYVVAWYEGSLIGRPKPIKREEPYVTHAVVGHQ